MKTLILLIIMLFSLTAINARDRDQEKKALQELLKERETRFGEYSRAAAARSGIFGNKTKNDLKDQVEVLTEIIKTDNKIISTLETFLDYRTFQQTTTTYSQADLDQKNQRLNELTTILSKKLKAAEASQKEIQISMKWARVWNYLFMVLVIVLGYLWLKERREVKMLNAKF